MGFLIVIASIVVVQSSGYRDYVRALKELERGNDEEDNDVDLDLDEELDDPALVRAKRSPWWRRVSISCTIKCTRYNWCRIKSFTLGNCKYPRGCDCNKFAWEG